MRRISVLTMALLLSASFLRAEDKPDYGDSTLTYYLSRADRVVVVKIMSDEVTGGATASGQVIYKFKALVEDRIKGADKKGDPISITAIRWDLYQEESALPNFAKGTRMVLFLTEDGRTADQWFGTQPFNEWMVGRLKRIASGKTKNTSEKSDARPISTVR